VVVDVDVVVVGLLKTVHVHVHVEVHVHVRSRFPPVTYLRLFGQRPALSFLRLFRPGTQSGRGTTRGIYLIVFYLSFRFI
jgi:hypothetical protein